MLYERWRQVAHDHHNELALFDPGRGRKAPIHCGGHGRPAASVRKALSVPDHKDNLAYKIAMLNPVLNSMVKQGRRSRSLPPDGDIAWRCPRLVGLLAAVCCL